MSPRRLRYVFQKYQIYSHTVRLRPKVRYNWHVFTSITWFCPMSFYYHGLLLHIWKTTLLFRLLIYYCSEMQEFLIQLSMIYKNTRTNIPHKCYSRIHEKTKFFLINYTLMYSSSRSTHTLDNNKIRVYIWFFNWICLLVLNVCILTRDFSRFISRFRYLLNYIRSMLDLLYTLLIHV